MLLERKGRGGKILLFLTEQRQNVVTVYFLQLCSVLSEPHWKEESDDIHANGMTLPLSDPLLDAESQKNCGCTSLELKILSFTEFITFASGKIKPLCTDSGENMLTVSGRGERRKKKNMNVLAVKIPKNRHFHFDFDRSTKSVKRAAYEECGFDIIIIYKKKENDRGRRFDSDWRKHGVLFVNPASFLAESFHAFPSVVLPLLFLTSPHHHTCVFYTQTHLLVSS